MAKSHSARSSDSNLQSRQQGGRGVRGRGLRDSPCGSGGAWARQRLNCELALERGPCLGCIRGARGEERPADS
jgi:hypothetical protein